ncbi:Threonine/homoserine efflux transporter RhtA [Oceanospirillum multiglobuliferum]|uniref:EamA family transporter n=1 Tax=Oceanospirillum multiglobuliferum TaxID=64969 RepID=A0A1T4LLD3_9GAMM|nr:DMT family transporter [Oceanospirillum multiglobuliferum]OPX56618.1 EamA family transporter [Oceanospirillum multiglobuliferum]SJZ55387.1 Threonine/homoserine efflux transporter RhtA [Oceanospirillum multiglobuliferum]
MQTRTLRSDLMLLLTAAIWGLAFVAQRLGMEHVGPFTFNASRFFLGALSLLPLLLFFKPEVKTIDTTAKKPISLWLGGAMAGMLLFMGAALQQVGLQYTTAGKAGFITGLYIILVPMLALFWGQRTGRNTWLGALLAVVGLYLLSINDDFSLSYGDLLQLIGAFFWAGHVLMIGWLSPQLDAIRLSIVQFFTCGVISLIAAFIAETPQIADIAAGWQPIAYAGLLSVGVAYTLQVVAQKSTPASHAAIILSLEAVFAVIGGYLMLNELLSLKAMIGCGLMLAGMLISQINPKQKPMVETAH